LPPAFSPHDWQSALLPLGVIANASVSSSANLCLHQKQTFIGFFDLLRMSRNRGVIFAKFSEHSITSSVTVRAGIFFDKLTDQSPNRRVKNPMQRSGGHVAGW